LHQDLKEQALTEIVLLCYQIQEKHQLCHNTY
jgi:hypothetical protein